jgi:hypothetical protein
VKKVYVVNKMELKLAREIKQFLKEKKRRNANGRENKKNN